MGRTGEKRRAASLALKGAVIAMALLGQYFTFLRSGRVSPSHFLYFTNISNLLSLAAALVFFVCEFIRRPPPQWLLRVRLACAAGIALVFVVFSAVLSPLMDAAYLNSRDNIIVHNLVPWLCVLDFLLFDHGYVKTSRAWWPGLASPLAYFALAFTLSRLGTFFGSGRYPYFFLNDEANGWFTLGGGKLGVAWWVLILCLLQWGISKALVALQRRVHAKPAAE